MKLPRPLLTCMAYLISFSLVEVSFAQNANAQMIPTSQALADLSRSRNLETVQRFLERSEVRNELIKQGVVPAEAEQRIASLSDFELQKIAGNIETAPAGAEPVLVVGLTTLLLIIIIVLLVR